MANAFEKIPFNRPHFTGRELDYIRDAFQLQQTAGNGEFTRRCQSFFETKYGFGKCLLTQSCTDALEMCALLAGIQQDDEVIIPSYTFVSTANAFALRGARIVFADSESKRPHVSADEVQALVTSKTKVIVVVHYGGTSVELEPILELAKRNGILVVEDAAHAIDSFYCGRPLGSFGDLATFSFHETKNIISGEGGMLVINRDELKHRSEILWEKGTNRSAFFRGEVAKYEWVDLGSSFLPSEITAATLWAQLESLPKIQARRVNIWNSYHEAFRTVADRTRVEQPHIGEGSTVNGHLYYLLCQSVTERANLINHLKGQMIDAVFHYQSLHSSPYYQRRHGKRPLPCADRYTDRLLRLPLYCDLADDGLNRVIETVNNFYE